MKAAVGALKSWRITGHNRSKGTTSCVGDVLLISHSGVTFRKYQYKMQALVGSSNEKIPHLQDFFFFFFLVEAAAVPPGASFVVSL